ncbi:MAG TPA: hypothetical protein PLX06_06525 [Fimbriimonadaceae bacterium]|nr:hypothetical protein [Fimbriimonadaceae bacterium]
MPDLSLDAFALMTIQVLEDTPIEDYSPTIVDNVAGCVAMITGIPAEIDHRDALIKQLLEGAASDNYFFGVRSGPASITIGLVQRDAPSEFRTLLKTGQAMTVHEVSQPEWWTI